MPATGTCGVAVVGAGLAKVIGSVVGFGVDVLTTDEVVVGVGVASGMDVGVGVGAEVSVGVGVGDGVPVGVGVGVACEGQVTAKLSYCAMVRGNCALTDFVRRIMRASLVKPLVYVASSW